MPGSRSRLRASTPANGPPPARWSWSSRSKRRRSPPRTRRPWSGRRMPPWRPSRGTSWRCARQLGRATRPVAARRAAGRAAPAHTSKPVFTVAMASTTEVPAAVAVPAGSTTAGDPTRPGGAPGGRTAGIASGGGDGEGAFQPASESDIATMPEVDTDACGKTIAYPDEAEQAGIEGDVRLRVALSPEGRVYAVRVLSGLGHGLDRAAMEALKHRCRFSPAIGKGGKAGRLRHPIVHLPFPAPALSPRSTSPGAR